jgi:primosomal protein N' (replication factor Y)
VFGADLADALGCCLARREQAILFLNRRGFASFLLCRDCGFTFHCPHCDVSLTYHHAGRYLQCHHCDHRRRVPDTCPTCGGLRLRPFGLGTEKVEDAVRRQFPQARTLRMDRDTMARKGAHAETLRAFKRGEADVLIGTQMVAKGLDFPRVTLVGVVSADVALNVPDFRAPERAFQLLTQVAGRAGRGRAAGSVIVQTFSPDHESVGFAARHDYRGFYDQAIAQRRELGYPPFSHLANLVVTDESEDAARGRCQRLADVLRALVGDAEGVRLLGPVACPLSRLRGRYRWHLALRAPTKPALLECLRAGLAGLTAGERSGLTVDIDPLSML